MYDILEPSDLALQDLYATESPVEGDYIYVHNSPEEGDFFTRDASYEEIMHLVHGKGIEDELPDVPQGHRQGGEACCRGRHLPLRRAGAARIHHQRLRYLLRALGAQSPG